MMMDLTKMIIILILLMVIIIFHFMLVIIIFVFILSFLKMQLLVIIDTLTTIRFVQTDQYNYFENSRH